MVVAYGKTANFHKAINNFVSYIVEAELQAVNMETIYFL